MKDFLRQVKAAVGNTKAKTRTGLKDKDISHFVYRYKVIIKETIAVNPSAVPVSGKRRKPKASKAANLARRLNAHRR